MNSIVVFSGSSHPALSEEVCHYLNVPLRASTLTRFSNDCLQVQLNANCREGDVYIIQPLGTPGQETLVDLLLMLDAARGASAARTTAVGSGVARFARQGVGRGGRLTSHAGDYAPTGSGATVRHGVTGPGPLT